MRTPLIIVGAGGHGRETALLVEQINTQQPLFDLLGFVDDDRLRVGTMVSGYPVLGPVADVRSFPPHVQVVLGVGAPAIKRQITTKWLVGRTLPILVHPSVMMGTRVSVGEGTQLHAGVILTTDITIGRGVTINRRVDISHDDVIGDFSTLAPSVSLAGAVHVEEGVDVGIHASCLPGIRLGAHSVIGAGAVVIRDVPAGATAVGVPARIVRHTPFESGMAS
jgi:sugar O-acyltransferase (sialic acid O-acetyltransferase NeuD family)